MKLLLVLGLFSFTLQAATLITGAGATFPYPLYSKWFSDYQKVKPEVQINYQSIGSGGGIRQFLEKTVDFGATDAPMTDEQMKKSAVPVVHIPTVLGAVVVTYNLPGVEKGLKLTPEIVAGIFLGDIKTWNDPKITKLNPTAKLSGNIISVHRSDGSGTTNIFTDYLSKVSEGWKTKVGTGTAVNWPSGLGGKGNEGVSGLIKQTTGSVGYVELIYAENNKLPYAAIQNKAGKFVEPTVAGKDGKPSLKPVSAAAAGAKIPEDFRVSITNADGKDAYPISGFTYLLVYQNLSDPDKGPKLLEFLKWSMKDGQKAAEEMFYAPLPSAVLSKVVAKLGKVTTDSAKTN